MDGDRLRSPYAWLRRVIHERRDLRTTSTANVDVTFGRVPPGEQWYVTHLTAQDDDSAPDAIRVFATRPGQELLIEAEESPSAATPYWTGRSFWLLEGEELVVRVVTPASGDDLQVHLEAEAYPTDPRREA